MDRAIVLDVLPVGSPASFPPQVDRELRRRNLRISKGGYLSTPVIFVIAKNKLFLALAVPSPGVNPKVGDEIDLNDRKKVVGWVKITLDELSSVARGELENALDRIIDENEEMFVKFFNRASPITTRLHSLELLPGIGKKHMWEIIEQRRRPFKSLNEIKERIPLVPDPK